jgi:hypothetical protein
MQVLTYLISLVIIFAGLGLGFLIAFFTKEELKAGKKYFKILQVIITASIIFLYLSEFKDKNAYIISLMFLFGLPTGTLIMKNIIEKKQTKLILKISYTTIYISFIILSGLLMLL